MNGNQSNLSYLNLTKKVKEKVKNLISEISEKEDEPLPTRLVKKIDETVANFMIKVYSTAWSIRNFVFGKEIVYTPPKFEEIEKARKMIKEKRKQVLDELRKKYPELFEELIEEEIFEEEVIGDVRKDFEKS